MRRGVLARAPRRIADQNTRRCSRRATGGRPGESSAFRVDPAERRFPVVIATSFIRVLRRPIESALRPRAATPPRLSTAPGCSATTAPASSRGTWRAGSRARASPTSAAHRTTPRPRAKIEHWRQTLKNRVLLENYFLPGQLEAAVSNFVDHYNNRRYHESLANLTPADVYFGRGKAILEAREKIKKLTIRNRRLSHHGRAA